MEEALLQSAVPVGGGGGDGDHSSGGGATKDDTVVVFPSYSLTDIDGVVHTCTVRAKLRSTTHHTGDYIPSIP